MTTAKPPLTKARSIIPILCGLLLSWLCLYMVRESLSVFFPPPKPDISTMTPETRQVVEDVRAYVAEKYPNNEQKGRAGATFFLVLCGFGLLFFGGGTLLVIYLVWISPPSAIAELGDDRSLV